VKRRETKFTILCLWCGERRECTRDDAKTCGARCRLRLSRFLNLVGFLPDGPVGEKTVDQAYKELVAELLARERARRECRAALDAKAAALLAHRT